MTTCPNCGHDLEVVISRDDLRTMTAQDIEAARRAGRLSHILNQTKETK